MGLWIRQFTSHGGFINRFAAIAAKAVWFSHRRRCELCAWRNDGGGQRGRGTEGRWKDKTARWRRSLSLSRVGIPLLSRHEAAAITPHSGAPLEGGVQRACQPALSCLSCREFWTDWEWSASGRGRKAVRICKRPRERQKNVILFKSNERRGMMSKSFQPPSHRASAAVSSFTY